MNDLLVSYRITGQVTEISESDDDLLIEDTVSGGRRTVAVTARRQMRLYEASIHLPKRFHAKDMVLANGYQSWTETRPMTRREHLNNLRRIPAVIEDRFHFKSYGSQAFWPFDDSYHLGFDIAAVQRQL